MTLEDEEKALIALLAKALLPEVPGGVSEDEIAVCLAQDAGLSEDEKRMLAKLDPLSFLSAAPGGRILRFTPPIEEELPLAVGYNRAQDGGDYDESTRAQIEKKRQEIIGRIKERKRAMKGKDTSGAESGT